MYWLIVVIRAWQTIVFLFSAGMAGAMALYLKTAMYRRILLSSFAVLCLGVSIRQSIRIIEHDPWTWWSFFSVVAGILATISFVVAWRSRDDTPLLGDEKLG